jgi:hypothetical protein
MKEHSCWMISEVPEAGFTANAVRAKMGDFSNIPIGIPLYSGAIVLLT